ncbi:heat shock factor binding protein 1-domain-containing protein [Hypoxylon trugodes]|uniref:heat shock factor binding protein 1-domain-containing protein n=1 Tax=Hypoxylon trugodes TaxID=326681 RepID=UPI00219F6F24|nr:heat shock factor binding protein 1-domain-containing protein [Hypoxylon trugodes]KAI1391505.1 heat shock factor binding protein 1-domain-containing protein [Hypoxylon trugodes]
MPPKKAEEPSKDADNSSDELAVVVEDLLESLSTKFDGVSSEIFAKSTFYFYFYFPSLFLNSGAIALWYFRTNIDAITINLVDEMARRLDDLEASLRAQEDKPSSPSKGQ